MKANSISGQLAGLTILVVEDGADNQRLFKHFLHMAGARVVLVEDGPSALERALSEASIDLVLMDIQIPLMDGFAVTAELRERGFSRPIIAVTAHALDAEAVARRSGISAYVAKPIEIERLIQLIRQQTRRDAPTDDSSARAQPGLSQGQAAEPEPHTPKAENLILSKYHSNPLYQSIISAFVQTFEQRIETMQSLINAMDWEQLAVALHQMKGAAATYGYPQVSATIFQMEVAAKEASRDAKAVSLISQKAAELQLMGLRMRSGLKACEQQLG